MDFTSLITNVGFPIACVVAMGKYLVKRDEQHTKEINELRKSIDNNTKVMLELSYFLKGSDNING